MVSVKIKYRDLSKEDIEKQIRFFCRAVDREGVIRKFKLNRFNLKPSVKRREKSILSKKYRKNKG